MRLRVFPARRHARSPLLGCCLAILLAAGAEAQVRVDESINITPAGQTSLSQTADRVTTLGGINAFGAGNNHGAAHGTASVTTCRLTAVAHGCNTVRDSEVIGGDGGDARAYTPDSGEPYRLDMPSVPLGTIIPVVLRTTLSSRINAINVGPYPSSAQGYVTATRSITRPGYGYSFVDSGLTSLTDTGTASSTGLFATTTPEGDNAVTLSLAVGDGYRVYMSIEASAGVYVSSLSATADAGGVMTWSMELPGDAVFINTRTGEPMCGSANTLRAYVDTLLPPPIVDDPCDLTITLQPVSVIVCPGGFAGFSTAATGTPPIAYQWQIRGGRAVWSDIANGPLLDDAVPVGVCTGTTTPTLGITTDPTASGTYNLRCMITSDCGRVWTNPADLIITPGATPVILQQPTSRLTCPSAPAQFSIVPGGGTPFTSQWQWRPFGTLTWINIANGPNTDPGTGQPAFTAAVTSVSVTLTNSVGSSTTVTGGRREIHVVLSNACGTGASTTSEAAVWTICPADFNCSGSISVQDIFDFLGAYFSGAVGADFNASGAISVQDIFDFLAAYFAGCA